MHNKSFTTAGAAAARNCRTPVNFVSLSGQQDVRTSGRQDVAMAIIVAQYPGAIVLGV